MQFEITPEQRFIEAGNENIAWCGRIDDSVPGARRLIFPYSSATLRFTSPYVQVIVRNHVLPEDGRETSLGVVLDGKEDRQTKVILEHRDGEQVLTLAEGLDGSEHTVFLFKRSDDFYEVEILGFVLAESGKILPPPKQPRKCIEFYGDSVTAGEVSEAVKFARKPDPENHGEYNNSYYSYAAITARLLNARVHLSAQGGIALLPHTGYFRQPNTVGMTEVFDRVRFNPEMGELAPWDFARFTPSVVVVAIGQNDDFPENYMRDDPRGEKAKAWMDAYRNFILSLRSRYPKAYIILTTTILNHAPQWDRAIGRVCAGLQENDDKIYHFLYCNNGRGTPGHVRVPEAEVMALELRAFINGLGTEVWR